MNLGHDFLLGRGQLAGDSELLQLWVGLTNAKAKLTNENHHEQMMMVYRFGAPLLRWLKKRSSVIQARLIPTIGEYNGDLEASMDLQVVATREFDHRLFAVDVIEMAQAADQSDVFVASLTNTHSGRGAYPGIAWYFREPLAFYEVMPLLRRLSTHNVRGFTAIGDPNASGGFIGVRHLVVPEMTIRDDPDAPVEEYEYMVDRLNDMSDAVCEQLWTSDLVAEAVFEESEVLVAGECDYVFISEKLQEEIMRPPGMGKGVWNSDMQWSVANRRHALDWPEQRL